MQHDPPTPASSWRALWSLDPDFVYLNHGAFGACPIEVQTYQRELRARIERQPCRFFIRDFEAAHHEARTVLADFLHADADDIAFLPNATTAVNTVLRSIPFRHGDAILTTDHIYNACHNVLRFVAARHGLSIQIAKVPFPIADPALATEAILDAATPQTRLALIDHITSPTALILPIQEIVDALAARGIDTFVDGAHAPGMIPLHLDQLNAAYYTGNCHKWLCAPKGAAFLHVRKDRQAQVHPLVISHGANSPRTDRSRFRLDFDWLGTTDPTPFLCVPHAIRTMASFLHGGWDALRQHNHQAICQARRLLCDTLEIPLPCPDGMLGSMASIPLPPSPLPPPPGLDQLQDALYHQHRIEIPVHPWPAPPSRLLRVSAQLYNTPQEYETLARALSQLLPLASTNAPS